MTPTELMVLRKQYGLTQAEFGERLIPPVSRLTVSNWERARFAIPHDLAERMVKLAPSTKPAETRAALVRDTVKYYGEMRRDTFTHESIVRMWQERGFTPSREAMELIAQAWPDILETPNDAS
jgi:transcriptional regulator with XRE-family HTH domain